MMAKIAVIGGTGLYDIEGLHIKEQFAIDTPFGAPSAELRRGEFDGSGGVIFAAAWRRASFVADGN